MNETRHSWRLWLAAIGILALAGCETGPLKGVFEKPAGTEAQSPGSEDTAASRAAPSRGPTVADLKFALGVKSYEEGNYKEAQQALQGALNDGLEKKEDQVQAYKYLAFIHCGAKREKPCREAFTKALELNPDFELSSAEAGHPVWGKVFREVKEASQAKDAKKALPAAK
ncbi:MAG: TssQ family T6SS-associated lipoprotein [Gammaproteobacteria bacterium]|nr:TssQ family T6SS-associated lipoprotein [Gammaproteobacteria bacterium]